MTREVQLSEPADELLAVAKRVTPGWVRRIVLDTAQRYGCGPDRSIAELGADVDVMAQELGARLIAELAELFATDVDEQRTNPLSLYRAAVVGPTALLREYGVPVPPSDAFGAEHFPDDLYGLGPAGWSDIDPELQQPGLVWGAWKAMTVLRRRREDGLR